VIFLTVGNYNPFPRLVRAVDRLKSNGAISDDVLLQIANMQKFESQVCQVVRFLPPDDYRRCIQDASVIVCHAGAGNLADALRAGKMPVVMPRRKKYGEHVDDHQMELAAMLSQEGRIVLATEAEDLLGAIAKARDYRQQAVLASPSRMVGLVGQALRDLTSCRRGDRP
jgi:beta-1,4-N-acetylglucosaminyltransferase